MHLNFHLFIDTAKINIFQETIKRKELKLKIMFCNFPCLLSCHCSCTCVVIRANQDMPVSCMATSDTS